MKKLDDIPQFDYLLISMLGLWGAIMNFLHRDKKHITFKKKMVLFVTDIVTSGGIAITVYLTLLGYTDNHVLSAGVAGILAHQGASVFAIMSDVAIAVVEQKLEVKLDKNENEKDKKNGTDRKN